MEMQGWTTSALIEPFDQTTTGQYNKLWTIRILCVICGADSLSFDVISVVIDATKELEQCKVNITDN